MSPGFRGIKTIRPHKETARPKPEKLKLERVVEHVRYGKGKPIEIRQLDDGGHAVVVKFGDGAKRVLRLEQRYWVSNIASLIPPPPKPARRASKKKALDIEENADGEEVTEAEAAA
ncbi:MAG: hypothetical protein WCA27_07280 [Candidatus Sulfotelmatobacter sp.]